jgi:membrane associated rhomboid family serine protease
MTDAMPQPEPPRPDPRKPDPPKPGPPRPEPILTGALPWGVGLYGLVILLVHLVYPPLGRAANIQLLADLAFVPARVSGADGAPPYGGLAEIARVMVTHQLLHAGWTHLAMNTLMLVSVGPVVERGFGPGAAQAAVRFIGFALVCGAGGAMGFWLIDPDLVTVMLGASGALSGVFAGFVWLALARARHDPRLRRAAFEAGLVFLALNVGLAAAARIWNVVPIAWESHLFGFLAGMIVYPLFAGLSWREALHILLGRPV